jgi:threonine dehydratase
MEDFFVRLGCADALALNVEAHSAPTQVNEFRHDILQVDNASISAAIKDVFNETRTILEPAGAVAVAGVKAYLKARPHIQASALAMHLCDRASGSADIWSNPKS